MAEKPIIWSEQALQELEDILDFYNRRNRSTIFSNKLLKLSEGVLDSISKNEQLGRKAKRKNVRIFPLKYFLIIYEIKADRIEVLSFWDNRQNLKKRRF